MILKILTRLVRITYSIRPQQRNLPKFMYLINVNILESQRAHSTNDLVCFVGMKMTDWWVETCSLCINKKVVLTYIINFIIQKIENLN